MFNPKTNTTMAYRRRVRSRRRRVSRRRSSRRVARGGIRFT